MGPDGLYGQPVVGWSELVGSAGNGQLITADLPPAAAGAKAALQLGASAAGASATAPADVNGPYLPRGTSPGFTLGLWAKNPGRRTLDVDLRVYNVAGDHYVRWNCAVDPGRDWVFLTLSPSQQITSGWVFGVDALAAVRIAQEDQAAEGAWQAGETLMFGTVYADLNTRPLFMITFDDGFDSQRNPDPPVIQSGPAYVARTDGSLFVTAARHALVRGRDIAFTDVAPVPLASATRYWVSSVPSPTSFTLASDATLATAVVPGPFAGAAPYQFAGTLLRSGQQIVESHGFKGSLFLVPSWLGTYGRFGYGARPNRFMSADDAKAMLAGGWSIGSHSNTHPSSEDNAGLRLLGPYGYFLSNSVDRLPARYVRTWGLNAGHRRRAVSIAADSAVVTFENPHRFLVNMPIVFSDAAPAGFAVGAVYFCSAVPSPTTATFATDQGTLADTVVAKAAWSGLANYRHAGAANDDSAIYADIMAGIEGVAALGISTGQKFFALPQGAADEFVRSACIRAGVRWVRGASLHAHSFGIGRPTGAGLSNIENTPGGWLAQADSVQTDAAVAPSITTIRAYIDDTITQQACGCSYHHHVGGVGVANLDDMCAYLREKVDARRIEVLTLDQMAAALKL